MLIVSISFRIEAFYIINVIDDFRFGWIECWIQFNEQISKTKYHPYTIANWANVCNSDRCKDIMCHKLE